MIFCRVIPESPRWLIANNQLDKAHEVLQEFAVNNGVPVNCEQLMQMIQEAKTEEERKKTSGVNKVLDLVRTRKLRKRTIICTFNW